MSIEKLKAALPEYAKDIKLNLSSITRSSVLDRNNYGEPCWPAPQRHEIRRY